MMDFRNNMQKCQEYIHALEDEKKKIQVFQRELPLCLELVTQAIEACKQQLCGNGTTTTTECLNGHSECSEQTTSDGPILEEFMPLKRSNSTDDEEDELESEKPQINNVNVNNNNKSNEKSGKKSDWLRSVQLWNQTPDPPTTQEDHQPKKVVVVEVKRNGGGGAFQPFQKEKNINGKENNDNNISNNNKQQPASTPAASACSSAQEAEMGPSSGGSGGSGGGSKKEKDAQSQRKARRCWSPELHRRFVHALQQLGGSHVATPKQIRDLMKVDGLTNDEVKSHLQKYRLHTRRPSSGVHNNANQQTPQFVVVGGIWVPPEYAATTAGDTNTVTAPGSIYAPIATVATPPHLRQTSPHMQHQKQSSQSHCEERGSHSEGGVHSNSPATSSSTHTTTASHAH